MYIVFEGLDWAGKDTQLQNVFKYLTNKFKYANILKTQEPSWITESWKIISEKLKWNWFKNPKEALDLYIKDRIEMNSIKKNNNNFWFILCSRWDYTTYAYQSLPQWENQWFSFDEIYNEHRKLEDSNEPLLVPNITFYFDLPISETMKRINARLQEWEKKDFFEREEFLEKARNQYLKSIEFLKNKEKRNIYIIDANKDRESIFKEIINILNKYIK